MSKMSITAGELRAIGAAEKGEETDPSLREALAYLDDAERRVALLSKGRPADRRSTAFWYWQEELLGIHVHCDSMASGLSGALWTNDGARERALILAGLLREQGREAHKVAYS